MGADEALLFENDHDKVINARATLTNPRRRLEAELAWLLDLTEPEKAYEIVKRSRRSLTSLTDLDVDTPLATLNALTHGLSIDKGESVHSLYHWIAAIIYAEQHLDKNVIFQAINRTRESINIPVVKDWNVFEAAYNEHLQNVARTINAVLKQVSEKDMVEALDAVINFPLLVHAKSELLAQIFDATELHVLPRFQDFCQQLELLTANNYTQEGAEEVGRACVRIARESRELSMPFVGWARVRCLSCRPSGDVIERARQLLWSLSNNQKNRVSAQTAQALTEVYKTSPTVVRLFNHDLEFFKKLALIESFTLAREKEDENEYEDEDDFEAQAEQERLEREEEERMQREEEERLAREEEARLQREEKARLAREEKARLKREKEERRAREEEAKREEARRREREAQDKNDRLSSETKSPSNKVTDLIEEAKAIAQTQGQFIESQLGEVNLGDFKRQFEQDVRFYAGRYGLSEQQTRRIMVNAHMEECLRRFEGRQTSIHDDLRPYIDWMMALKYLCHDANKRNDIASICLIMEEFSESVSSAKAAYQQSMRQLQRSAPQTQHKEEEKHDDTMLMWVTALIVICIIVLALGVLHDYRLEHGLG